MPFEVRPFNTRHSAGSLSFGRLRPPASVLRRMTGFLQTAFFFGYTLLGCAALAAMTGTIAVAASSVFVRSIYASIKVD